VIATRTISASLSGISPSRCHLQLPTSDILLAIYSFCSAWSAF
jgi:hypothetical protein